MHVNERVTQAIRLQSLGSARILFILFTLQLTDYSYIFAQRYLTTFGLVSELKTLRGARDIIAGDFNGDGITDIATFSGKKVQFHIRNTDSLEWHSFLLQLAQPIASAAAVQCNNDRLIDLVIMTENQPELQVYLAKPNGKFYLTWKTVINGAFDKFIMADMNNDGKMDIVLFGKKELGMMYFLSRGNGTFRSGKIIFPEQSFSAVTVADMNEDGVNDVIATNWISNELLLFSGIGKMKFGEPSVISFQSEPTMVAVDYLDSDVNKDLIVGFADEKIYQTYLGDGFGGFHLKQTVPLESFASQITVADMNGDEREDVNILSTGDRTLSIGLNNGKGILEEHIDFDAGKSPTQFVLILHPNTNFIDAAVLDSTTSRIRIFQNSQIAHGTRSERSYGVGLNPTGVVVSDINHDGWKDIVVANAGSQTISLLLNRMGDDFNGQIAFPSPAEIRCLRTYSLNDSITALIGTGPENNKITIMKINLHDYSSSSYALPTSDRSAIVTTTVDTTNNFLHIYSMEHEVDEQLSTLMEYEQITPTRFISHAVVSLSRQGILGTAMSDFDGDGNLDITYVIFDAKRKKEEVYTMQGTRREEFEIQRFAFAFDVKTPLISLMWNVDLNQDSVEDLVMYLPDPEQSVIVSLGRRDSPFSFNSSYFRLKDNISVSARDNVKFVDMDGDGVLDIVLENTLNKTIQTYFGRGDGTFSLPQRLISSEGIGGFEIADLNNDGILDLILTENLNGLIKIIPLTEEP